MDAPLTPGVQARQKAGPAWRGWTLAGWRNRPLARCVLAKDPGSWEPQESKTPPPFTQHPSRPTVPRLPAAICRRDGGCM